LGLDGSKLLKSYYGNKTDNKLLTYLCSSPDNKLVQPVESDFLAASGKGRASSRTECFFHRFKAKEIFTTISIINHGGNKSNM